MWQSTFYDKIVKHPSHFLLEKCMVKCHWRWFEDIKTFVYLPTFKFGLKKAILGLMNCSAPGYFIASFEPCREKTCPMSYTNTKGTDQPGLLCILSCCFIVHCLDSITPIWAMSWENLFMPYTNNKGADQPAHPRSLISALLFTTWIV